MEVLLLGPFEVRIHGEAVDLGDLQQRFILAVLVLHPNRAVSTERLTEIVWAGQARPRTNLVPGYIAKLRKLLGTSAIDREPTGYVLRIDPQHIDVVRFDALVTEARECGDPARRRVLLRAAVDLWRGRYLEDLDLDRVGAADLISPEEAYLDALGDLAELELGQGNHRWVRDRLRPVVRRDGTRHRMAGLLMRALVANGDRVKAMEVYHATRAALDEVGMEVPIELRKLARFTQRVEPHVALPAPASRFGGREDELASIEARVLVATAEHRPATVWISGMPGVGKTELAVQAAHRLRERFPDGRILVQLNGFTPGVAPAGLGEVLGLLLEALGVPPEQHPRALSQRIARYQSTLSGTRTLVVLDNASAEDQIRALLPAAAGCAALVTSRAVGGVDVEDEIRLRPLAPGAAATLLRELVGADRVGGRQSVVDEIVARCGCVPLSIRMVAAQLRLHRSWPLEHVLELLTGTSPWQAAFAVSYDHLPEEQQQLFRLLGRVPGVASGVNAAAALTGATVPEARALLEGLHGASLLEEPEPERYVMLDPLREFAAELPGPEPAGALTRLLDFYLVSVANAVGVVFPFDRDRQPTVEVECAVALEFADGRAARAWLSAERANLLEAIRYAAGHDLPEHTWQLAVLLWRWYFASGHLQEWSETLELARTVLERTGEDRRGLAYVLLRLSGAKRQAGKPAPAHELAEEARSLWADLGDDRGEATALCAIAVVDIDRGDDRAATAHFEAALVKFEACGDARGQANALSNLGQLSEVAGDLAVAEERHVAAAKLLRELAHTQGLAHALDNLGVTRQRLGRFDDAMRDHQEALELAVEVGDRSCEAYALTNIGTVHRLTGRLDEALRFHELARRVADEVREPGLRTQLYLDRGATHLARRDWTEARNAYFAALDLAGGTGDTGRKAHAHHGAARARHEAGEHLEAAPHWQAALAGFEELGWPEAVQVRAEQAKLTCSCASIKD
ncbi:tetratricopeptide repeat protein [Amycolatopsis sp. OK19-0408]|uniref:Tetratricopeptide repeat protein n=1 Tax=Amycolatopsis iheyensis TaxID=2945988 RepID=A0A9X2NPB1_9PSEU|nr:tetratricopeptide repeat protein [Amycolatopsis iheyensis]MCR6490412.1 tetratricopeptide repeat protein [Amycolatopsis iheyensis]